MRQLTVEDLGQLETCEHCRKLTYNKAELPKEISTLPKGFSSGNARMYVTYRGKRILLCATCRYDVYGGF